MQVNWFQFVWPARREIILCLRSEGILPPSCRVRVLRAHVAEAALALGYPAVQLQLRLYKTSLSYEEAEELFDTKFEDVRGQYQQLNSSDLVSELWPNGFDPSRVDLIVEEIEVEQRREPCPHPASYGAAHLASIHESTVKYLNRVPPPPHGAKLSNFIAIQNGKHPIRNGRSLQNTGLPISLYHKIFDDFLAATRGPPSAEYLKSAPVYEFICASRSLYFKEELRVATLEPLVNKLIGFPVFKDGYCVCESEWVVRRSDGSYLLMNEWKNEMGTGESDPCIESALFYSRCWGQSTLASLRNASCCPSFVLAIAGPWICVLGVIFLESVIVQPLTDFIWIGPGHCLEDGIHKVARVFEALSTCLKGLDSYYNELSSEEQPSRFFPWPSHFLGCEGREVRFQYIQALGGLLHERKSVFLAKTLEDRPRKIVVKFTTRYNTRAHRLMQAHGFAPDLYFDSSEHPAFPRPANLTMIVMEFITEAPAGPSHDEAYITLDTALDILHKEKLVFGDLRSPNILVPVVRPSRPPRAMLIDFDWCGEAGKDCYPWDINSKDIRWANGVGPGAVMDPRHDTFMLERLLE